MTQEAIIANVMGYWPPISTSSKIYVRNTLRGDKKPGCWFAFKWKYLRLFDYGDARYNKANYFDLVALKHFGVRTEEKPSIIPLVKEIINGMSGGSKITQKGTYAEADFNFDLRWEEGGLTKEIIDYYAQYRIPEYQLRNDGITSLNWYEYNSREYPKMYNRYYPGDLCIGLPSGPHKKVYRPYQGEGPFDKWVTNTTRDDYYHFPRNKSRVLILGSHKDGRSAYNHDEAVWAWQSETFFPSDHSIRKMTSKYPEFLYLGDIDGGGLKNAEANVGKLRRMGVNVKHARMPLGLLRHDIKDFAELVRQHPEHSAEILRKTIDHAT